METIQDAIRTGHTALGIELGSTRVKAVLVGPDHTPVASGEYTWESRLENGYWTYSLADAWTGVRTAFAALAADVRDRYGLPLATVGAMGISGMMHGYLPFDAEGGLLTAFRTWRNTTTGPAAAKLTELLDFNIPQRWSIAHLYQAVLNGEEHVGRIAFLTTLAGYIHWRLTGEKVLGVGEASGMFPIDPVTCDYDEARLRTAQTELAAQGVVLDLRAVLPRVLPAGAPAGCLTPEGARLLDPTGTLQPGVPLCPPEGDAGTGMAATNSVAARTGNVSAGTSVFAMVVLEHPLRSVHPELDIVTTPTGRPVAMVHVNTCTADLDAWVRLLGQMAEAIGKPLPKNELYRLFYQQALAGAVDAGGLVSFNCYSGEPVMGLDAGCPLLARRPDAALTLPNFARAVLYAAMAALKSGMDILLRDEGVRLDRLLGHGGLFKVPVVGQKLLAGALGVPVSVMQTAGEGGPWGMALLASYRRERTGDEPLEQYLDRVFAGAEGNTIMPDAADSEGFAAFLSHYRHALPAERAAVEALL